jgi:hypothetical protein
MLTLLKVVAVYRIPLHVTGLDLGDDVLLDEAARLLDVVWTGVGGRTIAVVYTADPNPVSAAIATARQIEAACPDARVLEVDQDLVGVSDIGHRIGISREGVRNWVEGRRGPGGFPDHVGTIGGGERGAQRVWRWADVNAWLRKHYELGDEEEHLTAGQCAMVAAALYDASVSAS